MDLKSLKLISSEHTGKLSDKWELYIREYDRIFSSYRDRPVNLLEIGIQNGGSLEIWSKFFPNAQRFVGCDINPKCSLLKYDDPRIAVVIGDANSDEAQAQILRHAASFDIVIDDGSHQSSDIVKSFCRYFPCLADGGIFIAEDLHCSYWREFQGRLLYRYSSMEFFKRLIDVLNYEHWGVQRSRRDIIKSFLSKYKTTIGEEPLQRLHSIEFLNSMCLVRKNASVDNKLGVRIVSGSEDQVVPIVAAFSGSESKVPPEKRRFFNR